MSSPAPPVAGASAEAGAAHARRWWVLLGVGLVVFLLSANNTVLNVIVPALGQALQAGASTVKWVIEAYILMFCGLMLTGGALADRCGPRPMILSGLGVFGLFVLLCGLSPSSLWLVVGRTGMGLGAAMMFPATLSVLKQVFSDLERPRAIALWSVAAVLGALLGPLIGGWLVTHFPWGLVFLYQLPVIALTALLCAWVIPRLGTRPVPLDLVGSALSVPGLALLVLALIEGPRWGLLSLAFWAVLALAALFLVGFVLWERRTPHPMLDVSLFANPTFSAASLSVVLCYFAIAGLSFALVQYLQYVPGYSPLGAALRTLPMAVAAIVGSVVTSALVVRLGVRWTIVGGLAVTTVSFLMFASLKPGTGDLLIVAAGLLLGLGAGLAGTASFTSILHSVSPEKAGSASAVNETGIELGNALGLAVLGTVLTETFVRRLQTAVPSLDLKRLENPTDLFHSAHGAAFQGLQADALLSAARQAFSSAMDTTALVGTVIVLAGLLVAWRFLPDSRSTDTDDH